MKPAGIFDTNHNESQRLNWIDQVKGFTIFLVVYGHNFPFTEKYIYTFHMPLFIMVAGFFHPKTTDFAALKKRMSTLLIPYFIWAFLLYAFWFFLGRNYGDSAAQNLSPVKNFIGIFYAQGGPDYMNWGIPLWFLPALFCTFSLLFFIKRIKNTNLQYVMLIVLPVLGFGYTRFTSVNLPWSINIAMVALLFYAFGSFFFKKINSVPVKYTAVLMVLMGLINCLGYYYNTKIDMYRAYYGNEIFFIINGISGSLMVLFFFKTFPVFKFLELIGKFSLTILVLQLIAMTFIKFVLLFGFHQSDFNFSEWERFIYAIVQIVLMIPGFYIINRYLPILNGGYKKI